MDCRPVFLARKSVRKGYPLYIWFIVGCDRVDVFGFESNIVHENVVYVELVRGEGLNGGDALVVGVQVFKPPSNAPSYFRIEGFGVRVNKYRFSMHVESLDVIGTSDVVELKLGNRIRYSFPKPTKTLIKVKYGSSGVSISVIVE